MSNNKNNTSNNEKKGKAPWSSVKNSMVSAIAHTKTGSKNTTQTVKIQLTNQKIVDQKHKFGVEYMDLLLQDAPKDALQKCVELHLQEIMRLRDKLDKYHGIINTNKLKLETKLCKLTGKPLPHTQPSVEVTQNAAEEEEEEGLPPPVFPDVGIGVVDSNTSASPSPSPSASIGASASVSPTDSAAVNPFAEDEEDDDAGIQKPSAQPIHAPLITAVPMAEAVPVSDMNNPFDDDDDENNNDKAVPPAAAEATKPASINPFGDDDDDDDMSKNKTSPSVAAAKPASPLINPFGDDDEDEIIIPAAAAKPAAPTINPFEDDEDNDNNNNDKPSSMNPFDEDDDYNAKKARAAKKKTRASKKKMTEC